MADDNVEQDVKDMIELRRQQRNQRWASAHNIVTQARMHDGRPAEIASEADAATARMIAELLEVVAGGKPTPLDPLFSLNATVSKRGRHLPKAVELAVAAITQDQTGEETKQ